MSAVPAANDSANGRVATADTPPNLPTKIGQLTRCLHENLRELGYDRKIEAAAVSIPDARAAGVCRHLDRTRRHPRDERGGSVVLVLDMEALFRESPPDRRGELFAHAA